LHGDDLVDHELGYGAVLGAGSPHHPLRSLRGRASSGSGDEFGIKYNEKGVIVYLQAVVSLAVALRVLYFFRGSLKLGALTHTLGAIAVDIRPLIILVLVFVVGFCAAAMILIIHELDDVLYGEWHNPFDALLVMLNIGLYTYYTETVFARDRRFLLIMYQLYMILVQVVLLNMLIAVMSKSHDRVSEQSELVALNGRAKLILEYEAEQLSQHKKRGRKHAGHIKARTSQSPFDVSRLLEEHEERQLAKLQHVCPRWLHVLMPAEHQRGDQGAVAEELRQLKELKMEVASMAESLGVRQQKLLDEISARDPQGERQRIMQAMRVEMSQLREDVKGDLAALLKSR